MHINVYFVWFHNLGAIGHIVHSASFWSRLVTQCTVQSFWKSILGFEKWTKINVQNRKPKNTF
jgi:hypothetical protein